jgi:hypothetical protein
MLYIITVPRLQTIAGFFFVNKAIILLVLSLAATTSCIPLFYAVLYIALSEPFSCQHYSFPYRTEKTVYRSPVVASTSPYFCTLLVHLL